MTSVAHASPDGTDKAFLWNVQQISNEVGLHKDVSGLQVRVFRHDFKIDSAATLSNEHTYFHAWTDHYQANLVQIRVALRDISGNGDFVFALYAADSSGNFTQNKYSFDHFQRNQWYTVDLYIYERHWLSAKSRAIRPSAQYHHRAELCRYISRMGGKQTYATAHG